VVLGCEGVADTAARFNIEEVLLAYQEAVMAFSVFLLIAVLLSFTGIVAMMRFGYIHLSGKDKSLIGIGYMAVIALAISGLLVAAGAV
jgi:hypothetical protein